MFECVYSAIQFASDFIAYDEARLVRPTISAAATKEECLKYINELEVFERYAKLRDDYYNSLDYKTRRDIVEGVLKDYVVRVTDVYRFVPKVYHSKLLRLACARSDKHNGLSYEYASIYGYLCDYVEVFKPNKKRKG
jgi:hypothetical protein